MRYSSKNDVTLKEAIDRLLDSYKLRGKLNENKLIHSWEKIMGKIIAKHTRELYLNNRKLYIKLDSSVLRQELSYAKPKIIERINQEIGHPLVEELVLM